MELSTAILWLVLLLFLIANGIVIYKVVKSSRNI